ncbi:MAG: hypothetical protein ACRDFQ_08285 [Anaerolineales bacterium]
MGSAIVGALVGVSGHLVVVLALISIEIPAFVRLLLSADLAIGGRLAAVLFPRLENGVLILSSAIWGIVGIMVFSSNKLTQQLGWVLAFMNVAVGLVLVASGG